MQKLNTLQTIFNIVLEHSVSKQYTHVKYSKISIFKIFKNFNNSTLVNALIPSDKIKNLNIALQLL